MKPLFIKFKVGKGTTGQIVYVNMSQVCHIMTDGATGSVLTFVAILNEEPAYLVVSESPDEIGARPEWKS